MSQTKKTTTDDRSVVRAEKNNPKTRVSDNTPDRAVVTTV